MPHGEIGSFWSLRMAMARNFRWPMDTERTMADLSAQMPAPYEAFSTFAPVITCPSSVSKAHPTLVSANLWW